MGRKRAGRVVAKVMPTERQLAFAMCLGIKLPHGISYEEVGGKVDRALRRAGEQDVNVMQKQIAELWSVDLDGVVDRDEAAQIL